MSKPNTDMYDAVIIGAGIGGLVCGCYLAKAGMKVLIAEQHFKPGGYCTSFKRRGFTFDAAAHCFGAYRKEGITRRVFNDLHVDNRLNIGRFDPTDTIITPDYKISFWSDSIKTIKEFQQNFPEESDNVVNFFDFLLNPDPNSFSRTRRLTFQDLLDHYFTDNKLKTILAAPLLGNGGLPPSLMSAFISAKLFSEFLLDGGYYPKGGMQAIPDALAESFKEFGGELRLSTTVKKIKVKDHRVQGVVFETNEFIPARYVVSNCDARQTFLKLLGKDKLEKKFHARLLHMQPSMSDFVLYLGLDGHLPTVPPPGTSLWFFTHYDLDNAYQAALRGDLKGIGGYFLRVAPDRSTLLAIIPAPYKNIRYWKNNKLKYSRLFIELIEKDVIPYLSKHIMYEDAATPHTLHRYTRNYRGSSFGWAGLPSQLALPDFRKHSFIKNLYLAGHWTTQGLGISGVAYVGCDIAKVIMRKERIDFK